MFEDSKPFQLDLLHPICENVNNFGNQLVVLACSCNQTHSVLLWGFLILDEVQLTLGSTEQSVKRVHLPGLFYEYWQWLPDLMRRLARQQEMVEVVHIGTIRIDNKETAELFSALTENCQTMCFETLEIEQEIGAGGWAAIRKALQLQGKIFPGYEIWSSKRAIVQGDRDDMRAIWDSIGQSGSWYVMGGFERLENLEMLEEILDTKSQLCHIM